MSADDRKRIIERIEKCLNLAKSNEPHEAAAALRQAQKLMAAHGVSEDDIFGKEVESEIIITPEPAKSKLPLYMSHLIGLIQSAFGVSALIEPVLVNGKYRMGIRYFGPHGRAKLAVYTHAIIWRQLSASWKDFVKKNPWKLAEKGARQGFWLGWISAVRAKVIAFGYVEPDAPKPTTPEESATRNALVVKLDNEMTKIADALNKYCPNSKPMNTNKMSLDGESIGAGREAAKNFSLNRGMEGSKRQIGYSN